MTKILKRLGFAAAAVLVAGPAMAQDVGTVTVFHRWADEATRVAHFDPAFAVCQSTLPGLDLKMSFVPSDQYEVQLPIQLSSSTPPDVYGLWPGGRAVFQAQAGNILDLTEVWNDTIGANFSAGMTQSVTETDGKIYVVPFNTIPNGFLYSKAAFKKAGIDQPPATWEEFTAGLKKLRDSGVTPLALGSKGGWEPMFWFDYLVLRIAGSEFRERLMWGKESYLDPKVIRAMELWKGMLDAGDFQLMLSGSWQDMTTAIITGDAAMELMGPWAMGAFQSADMKPDVDFGFFPFPSIDPAVATATEGAFEGWAASGRGKNTAGAVKLLECLASQASQTAYAKDNTNLAANQSVPVEVYSEDLRPILAKMAELNKSPFHQNMELATLPPVTEVAKRELARFLAYPDTYMDALNAIEQRAKEVFK